MRPHFDPRAMLKQSSIPFLRQFFDLRGELQDLPWEEMQKNRRFDLIYHAWQSAAKATRECISAILGISHGFRSPEDATRLSKHMLPSARCIISDDRGRLKKLAHLANFIFTWAISRSIHSLLRYPTGNYRVVCTSARPPLNYGVKSSGS